jgi:hypothetical protein
MIKRGRSTILKNRVTYEYYYGEGKIISTKKKKPNEMSIIISKSSLVEGFGHNVVMCFLIIIYEKLCNHLTVL